MVFNPNPDRRQQGMSLIELMVGMTIGFIAMVIIIQTLSVFDAQKRTTTGVADAQENGLLALMAIEADVREAGAGFNAPLAFGCQNFFSYYQAVSGVGAAIPVASFFPVPVLINQGDAADEIIVRRGLRFTGSIATMVSDEMPGPFSANSVQIRVDRAFDFSGEPILPTDPPDADLIMVVSPDSARCSLMRVSGKAGNVLTMTHGPAGKTDEYNAPQAFMTANNWPGFGATPPYPQESRVYRIGDSESGGISSRTYSIDTNNSLRAVTTVPGAASQVDLVAGEIVALKAQYGISANPAAKNINAWVNPNGATWGLGALSGNGAAAISNRQRIKAIRVAVVARSDQPGGAVTTACTENNAVNFGPCAWTDDTAANPAPAIDLRGIPGWQNYRYKVYQTVIPMRNVLWPNL